MVIERFQIQRCHAITNSRIIEGFRECNNVQAPIILWALHPPEKTKMLQYELGCQNMGRFTFFEKSTLENFNIKLNEPPLNNQFSVNGNILYLPIPVTADGPSDSSREQT